MFKIHLFLKPSHDEVKKEIRVNNIGITMENRFISMYPEIYFRFPFFSFFTQNCINNEMKENNSYKILTRTFLSYSYIKKE